MATYLTLFDNKEEYDKFINSEDFKRPNVSFFKKSKGVRYHKKPSLNTKINLEFNIENLDEILFYGAPSNAKSLKLNGNNIPIIEPEVITEEHLVNAGTLNIDIFASEFYVDVENEVYSFPSNYVHSLSPDSTFSVSPMDPSIDATSFDGICLLGEMNGEMLFEPIPSTSSYFSAYFIYDELTNSYSLNPELIATIAGTNVKYGLTLFKYNTDSPIGFDFIDSVQHVGAGSRIRRTEVCDSWTFEILDDTITFNDDIIVDFELYMNGESEIKSYPLSEMLADELIILSSDKVAYLSSNYCSIINDTIGMGFCFKTVDGTPIPMKYTIQKCIVSNEPLIATNIGKNVVEIELKNPNLQTFNSLSTSLTSCKLSRVNSIPDSMFSGMTKLSTIILSEGLTTIGASAFTNCNNLQEITLPNSLITIGNHAFSECTKLSSISIPSSVNNIGDYAFHNCINLPVIDSVRYADTYLIGAVDKTLSTYNIKENTKWIGSLAFNNCSKLTSFNIPSSVISIGYGAFAYSSGLTSITIPESVNSIGENVFTSCTGLSSMEVSKGNTVYDSRENSNCIIETNTNTLVYGCKNSVIPNTVSIIGKNSFRDCVGLKSLNIPSSVKIIDDFAFTGCYSLTGELAIPGSVTTIGESAFHYCYKLTSIIIPDSVTTIEDYCFYDCLALTQVTLGSGLKSIGFNAFRNCSNLSLITCNAITAPSLMGSYVFYNLPSYGKLIYPEGSDYSSWLSSDYYYLGYYNWNKVLSVVTAVYSATSTSQKERLCYSATNIVSMTIDGVKQSKVVSAYTFSTKGLHTVEFMYDGTTIGEYAFVYSPNLISIDIPDTITTIGESAFAACQNLTSLSIGPNVISIGDGAFAGCIRINSIVVSPYNTVYDSRENCNCIIETATNKLIQGCNNSNIPDSIEIFGVSAFNGCSGLTNIIFSNSVTRIESSAFNDCSNLKGDLVIPDSVTYIGYNAFNGCNGLSSIYIGSGVSQIESFAFGDCFGLNSIVVSPDNTVYDSRENCNCIIKTANNNLLYGCNNSFIPNSVTVIGSSAFSGYKGMSGITIPNSVTHIIDSAFMGCTGLRGELVLPDSVTNIGYYTFGGCSGLTSVVFGTGITSIGSFAFGDCSGLTSITCNAMTAPSISSVSFKSVANGGVLYTPQGATGYDSWMSTGDFYLGKYNWTQQTIS